MKGKVTAGLTLRIDPDLKAEAEEAKGEMTLTELIERLLRAYVAGRVTVEEEE